MSEQRSNVNNDKGLTLVELVITISVLGLITTVIATSLIVALRTQRGSEGRLNVARAEQNVATWMPADLASARDAESEPDAVPCTTGCDVVIDGSNALMLSWPNPDGAGLVTVSYRYRPAGDGETYELIRIKCTDGTSCQTNTILRDLDGPPVAEFVPGVTAVPDDVINVTVPLKADAIEDIEANEEDPDGSTARRIVVTINGGGRIEGGGGGVNRVSITAGGTSLGDLVAEKVTGPSFSDANSRCGGPITIVVDDSGSIGSGLDDVKSAVSGFVRALAGTPTEVQIVKFSTEASTIESSEWNYYHPMLDAAVVADLAGTGEGGDYGKIGDALVANGGTNWEDAMFRALYDNQLVTETNGDETARRLDRDGKPQTKLPELVVFFTDGEPTYNRQDYAGDGAAVPTLPATVDYSLWAKSNGNGFDQEGYDRAAYLINDFRQTDDVRIIGVGVGGIADGMVYAYDDDAFDYYDGGIHFRGREREYPRYYPKNDPVGSHNGSLYWIPKTTPTEKVLGNFVAGGSLQSPGDSPYLKSVYDAGTNTWSDIDTANMFITEDFSALPSALTSIALGECGGTLTIQTRLGSVNGTSAPKNVSYESGGEKVTTSAVNRAAAFDVTLPNGVAASAAVIPQSLEGTGYTAQSWNCFTKGKPLDASKWSYDVADPSAGVDVTVSANEAVACTMVVST